ncbi:hypothetical protein COCSADRAFT_30290 [Bipolaris sorokiniana ND90Pr]|uniref:Uncharacterized protein n=1 Tax=Cochliobolus sativus (strain ND90Pr / ATCC 201652) TaxID=665912 RepID=M2SU09_COCSN|nr:uncharacterized protein COCSADRAFT_30290 [Bipolaris sorokiniana ND90Pr]EMD60272.1 hypothetical protein COCSADRAFT_30290 [Bipolaris sorokiniana ND90Pr]
MLQGFIDLSDNEPTQCRTSSFKITLIHVTISTLTIWGFFDICLIVFRNASWEKLGQTKNDTTQCWCGTQNEEVVAMGCIYDHIAVDWLPSHCHDADLVAEFDASGPGTNGMWPYYRIESQGILGRNFIPIEDDPTTTIDTLAQREENYWATTEWHVAHCLFTWRKQIKFLGQDMKGHLMEPWNARETHAKHCSEYIWNVIRQGRSLDEITTFIPGNARHVDE